MTAFCSVRRLCHMRSAILRFLPESDASESSLSGLLMIELSASSEALPSAPFLHALPPVFQGGAWRGHLSGVHEEAAKPGEENDSDCRLGNAAKAVSQAAVRRPRPPFAATIRNSWTHTELGVGPRQGGDQARQCVLQVHSLTNIFYSSTAAEVASRIDCSESPWAVAPLRSGRSR